MAKSVKKASSKMVKSKPTKSATRPARATPARSKVTAKQSRNLVKSNKPAKKVAAKVAPAPTRNENVIIPPPPTNGKPRKNLAGLTSRELEHFRELLLEKRRELLGDMTSMESEALHNTGGGGNLSNLPIHMADMGTDNYEQEFTLGLMEKDRGLLRDINRALVKLQDGTYGICEGTGKPITKPRLEAQPWARHSIEHARKLEKGPLR